MVRSNKEEQSATTELITPEMARRYLEKNPRNRSMRDEVVHIYAQDMINGQWVWNGETIKLTSDDVLVDGQHRLAAIIRANMSIPMLVAHNVPMEAQPTIDTGAKRTAADALRLDGEEYPKVAAAIAKRVLIWNEHNRKDFPAHQKMVSHQQILNLVQVDEVLESAVRFVHGHKLPASKSVLGLAYYMCSPIDSDDAKLFFSGLVTGGNLSENDPVLVLRNRLQEIRSTHTRRSERYLLAIIIKGWNFHRERQQIKQIRWGEAEPFPIPR